MVVLSVINKDYRHSITKVESQLTVQELTLPKHTNLHQVICLTFLLKQASR